MKCALVRLLWLVPLLTLAACSDNEQQAKQPSTQSATSVGTTSLPSVLEVFEIGSEVVARSLAIDIKTQALWVGTSLGVHEIDLASYDVRQTYNRVNGLANEYVFAIHVDRQGGQWFGTNGGGASRLYQDQWRTFFPLHGLADYWVYSFAEQSNGVMWIGTWAGVNRYAPDTDQMTRYVSELVNEWVYGMDVDAQDRVWFGTEGGVSMYDGQNWQSWTHADGLGAANNAGLPVSINTGLGTRNRHDLNVLVDGQQSYNPNYVLCLLVDSNNHIWAGTWGGGVSRYDGQRWSNLTTSDGLAGNIVFSMTEDAQGKLWFGTQQGISVYDGKTWFTLGPEQGIVGDSIYALAALPDGEVWAGSKGAVMRIGKHNNIDSEQQVSK